MLAPAAVPAVVLPLIAVLLACGGGAEQPTGAELYARHCAACHGSDGRGDGPAAAALATPPADLTALQQDVPQLMQSIDGSRTVRSHGTSEMPVWGPLFEDELHGEPHARRTTLLRIEQLAAHVHGLQRARR